MRINYFVGIEGTFGLIRRSLGTNDGPFNTFFGDAARAMVTNDESLENILQELFGDYSQENELNIGVTRMGAAGALLPFLTEKSPAGTRIFFFKSTDNNETVDLYKSFLTISATKNRIERLTGMSEAALLTNSDSFTEATFEALLNLDDVSKIWTSTEWAPFDASVLSGGQGDPASKILFKVATLQPSI